MEQPTLKAKIIYRNQRGSENVKWAAVLSSVLGNGLEDLRKSALSLGLPGLLFEFMP